MVINIKVGKEYLDEKEGGLRVCGDGVVRVYRFKLVGEGFLEKEI